jgi:hypothetical protein
MLKNPGVSVSRHARSRCGRWPQLARCRVEFVEQFRVLGVGRLRPVERDRRDAIAGLVVDVHGESS